MDNSGDNIQADLFWEIWQHSPDNMFILRVGDDDFYIVNTNQSQQDTIELDENVLNGRPLKEVLPADFYDFVTPNYHRCMREKKPVQYEEAEYYTSQDGQPNHWSTILSPVLNEHGEVVFIFGISRNITALKRSQEKAEQAAREAEQANQVKTAFLANMSHEMRTPLNGILASADLLSERLADGEAKELCSLIQRSSEALTRLTSDILEFARIDAGKLKLEPHHFSLALISSDLLQLLGPEAAAKSIGFSIDGVEALPSVLWGDAGRLRQILLNLVGNAIKFTAQGNVHVRFQAAEKTDAAVLLRCEVRDTGIGIAAPDLNKLFRPFSQVDDSTTRRFGGTGLGLAISKYLVDKMGGSIQVSSEPGSGSCFSFTLPLECRSPAPATEPPPRAAAPVQQPLLQDKQVLLVEDNITNQMVIEKILRTQGMQVTVAHNGRQALEQCQQRTFDVILMDWHMPLMDGLEATRAIRCLHNANAAVPLIGLTANVMAEDREACLQAGMDEVVTKPVNRQHLLAEISRFIQAQPI
ncbi:MAG: response regulator [Pseudomonadota bacterium]|nr:response regulator [Pseudomonadota bacterium]